jgi:hypothetical protein
MSSQTAQHPKMPLICGEEGVGVESPAMDHAGGVGEFCVQIGVPDGHALKYGRIGVFR